LCQKLLKSVNLFQVTIDKVGDVLFTFLYISMNISLCLLSQGSAEAEIG